MVAMVAILALTFGLVLLAAGKPTLAGNSIPEGWLARLAGGALAWLVSSALLAGCTSQVDGPGAARTPGPTMPSLPTATPGPVQVADLHSVCVRVSGAHTAGLEPALHQLLQALQLQALDPDGSCDATLSVALDGTPLPASYPAQAGSQARQCFSGVGFRGEIGLSAPGAAPLSLTLGWTDPPPQALLDGCPTADEAPYAHAWSAAVLEGMAALFGDRAIARAARVSALREAAVSLASAGGYSDPKGMAQELAVLLDDPDPGTRFAAARLLGAMRPVPTEDLPVLVQRLVAERDDSYGVKDQLWSALHNAGPQAATVLPEVIDILWNGESSYDRSQAADVLGAIGPQALPATEALVAALKDPDPWVRKTAAGALGRIRAAPRDSVPALIAALLDPEPDVRRAAELSLHQITGVSEGFLGQDARAWEEWWRTQPK